MKLALQMFLFMKVKDKNVQNFFFVSVPEIAQNLFLYPYSCQAIPIPVPHKTNLKNFALFAYKSKDWWI